MQQSTERDISIAFQRLSITPETRERGNELKKLITPFKTKIFTAIATCAKKRRNVPIQNLYLGTLKRMMKQQTFQKIR